MKKVAVTNNTEILQLQHTTCEPAAYRSRFQYQSVRSDHFLKIKKYIKKRKAEIHHTFPGQA